MSPVIQVGMSGLVRQMFAVLDKAFPYIPSFCLVVCTQSRLSVFGLLEQIYMQPVQQKSYILARNKQYCFCKL